MIKIIELNENTVTLADSKGKIKEFARVHCNFEPQIGDIVELFDNNNKPIIHKVTEEEKSMAFVQNSMNIDGETTGQVNKIIYILLAIFLGNLGVHHFYANNSSKGIKYLLVSVLLFWLFIPIVVIWILCIMDAIKAASAQSDAYGNISI